jgi:hypothetical protein
MKTSKKLPKNEKNEKVIQEIQEIMDLRWKDEELFIEKYSKFLKEN